MKEKFSIFNIQFPMVERLIIGNWKLKIFGALWRLAILVLPWQTRWFSDAWLAGWPWEQGRLSFYASWIPMLVFIAFSFRHSCDPPAGGRNPAQRRSFRPLVAIGVLIVLSALNILRDQASLRPILEWWMQIGMLALFIGALWWMNVSRRSVATWFIISLIPHALLGILQFASQQVVGSKWLGIATQLPQTLGVSVVAHDGLRVLRAYGGFPHPNIFGGWLAIGVVVSVWLAMSSMKRRDGIVWTIISSLFMSALVLTFARGAWLAAAVGFVTLIITVGAGLKPAPTKARILYFLFPIVILSFVILSQRQHVFARFDLTQRLEQKSVNERVGSLRTGVDLFLEHPLIGTGPNAELLSLATGQEKLQAPLEPPHNAFLLALDDVGIIGIVAIIMLIWSVVGARFPRPVRSEGGETPPLHGHSSFVIRYSLFTLLAILALFDHYLWSTWSGQALVAIVIFLSTKPQTDP